MLEWKVKDYAMDVKILRIMFNVSVVLTIIPYLKASLKRPKVIP